MEKTWIKNKGKIVNMTTQKEIERNRKEDGYMLVYMFFFFFNKGKLA